MIWTNEEKYNREGAQEVCLFIEKLFDFANGGFEAFEGHEVAVFTVADDLGVRLTGLGLRCSALKYSGTKLVLLPENLYFY